MAADTISVVCFYILALQLAILLRLCFYLRNPSGSFKALSSLLKWMLRHLWAGFIFPSNQQGLKLQLFAFRLLAAFYSFADLALVVGVQMGAYTTKGEYGPPWSCLMYLTGNVLMISCPGITNTRSLTAWVTFYFAVWIFKYSPLTLTVEQLVYDTPGSALGRVALITICPNASVGIFMQVVWYVYVASRIGVDYGLLAGLVLELSLVILLALVGRIILEALVSLTLKLQTQSVEVIASRSLLSILCDAVIELDSDLYFQEDSSQLAKYLSDTASSLKGEHLSKFLASDEETSRFYNHLKMTSTTSAASAFHTSMKDALEIQREVELLHVSLPFKNGENHLLVGIRGSQEDSADTFPSDRIVELKYSAQKLPSITFSVDSLTILRSNEDWDRLIAPMKSLQPLEQLFKLPAGEFQAMCQVLRNECTYLYYSSREEERNVKLKDVPLANFNRCGHSLPGEVRLYEDPDKEGSFLGQLSVNVEDVICIKALQASSSKKLSSGRQTHSRQSSRSSSSSSCNSSSQMSAESNSNSISNLRTPAKTKMVISAWLDSSSRASGICL